MGETPPFQVLNYGVADHVCTIELNRPEKRNALSTQLVNELIFALETAGEDTEVRVIVLTGAGGSFCAGADLAQMGGGDVEESTDAAEAWSDANGDASAGDGSQQVASRGGADEAREVPA